MEMAWQWKHPWKLVRSWPSNFWREHPVFSSRSIPCSLYKALLMIQALCRTVKKSKTTSINHCNFPKCAKIHKTRVKEIQRIYYTCPTYSKCFEALTIYFKKANSILLISSVDVDYGGPWPVPLFHHHVEVIKCKKSAKEMRRLCDWRRCILMYTAMRMGPSWKNVCCSETNCARVCVCGCSFVGSCQFTKNIASMGSLFACASLSKGNALKKYSWTELNPNLPQLQVNAQWFDTRLFKYDNCVIFCSILQLVHNPQPIKN